VQSRSQVGVDFTSTVPSSPAPSPRRGEGSTSRGWVDDECHVTLSPPSIVVGPVHSPHQPSSNAAKTRGDRSTLRGWVDDEVHVTLSIPPIVVGPVHSPHQPTSKAVETRGEGSTLARGASSKVLPHHPMGRLDRSSQATVYQDAFDPRFLAALSWAGASESATLPPAPRRGLPSPVVARGWRLAAGGEIRIVV